MCAKIQVKAYALRELHYGNFHRAFNGWTFRDFKNDSQALHEWIAFTTVMYCPVDGLVHCGLTRFDNDILYVFDPESETFHSLNYHKIAESFEVKIHRSLVFHDDGYI